ncbi:MAG: hypothetical protein ACTSWI_06110 [Alphaproteobacteria bacterium]
MSSQSDDEEAPLDPALLRVQSRLRRLMLIGMSTLVIGVVAVLIAIIYRFYIADDSLGSVNLRTTITGEITAESVGLAPEAMLLEQTIDGNQMVLTFQDGPDFVTVIIDTATMQVTGQLRVRGEE